MKTCVRYLAVVFAVAMLICAAVTVSAEFPDVPNTHANYEAIEKMTNLGVIGGYEDETFQPDGLVRRDEMAKIIYAMYTTSTDAGNGSLVFPDVAANSWAKGYISWCAAKKIVSGYEDGTFRPGNNITYDEALKMVCAMLGYVDFKAELWPYDVRSKGLNELKLGEGLEDITGGTPLTRAQVVQLVYNAFDKPLYVAPTENEDDLYNGILNTPTVVTSPETIKNSIWKITEVSARIVATENYGMKYLEKGIDVLKTDSEKRITICIENEDGTLEAPKTIKLSEIGLEDYEGKTDSLLMFNIEIIKSTKDGSYKNAVLKGTKKSDIAGGYGDVAEASETFTRSNGVVFATYGVKLNGVNHFDDDFKNLRRVTWYKDFVLIADGLYNTDSPTDSADYNNGAVHGMGGHALSARYSNNAGGTDRWKDNFAFIATQAGYARYIEGYDADSDGYFDYVMLEVPEYYKVKTLTSKKVTLEYLFASETNVSNWTPIPEYNYHTDTGLYCEVEGCTDSEHATLQAHDLEFDIDSISAVDGIEKGDIFYGYPKGDKFVVLDKAKTITAYATSYASGEKSVTLNGGTTLEFKDPDKLTWITYQLVNTKTYSKITGALSAANPVVGVNTQGEYNYIKYYAMGSNVFMAENVGADEAKANTTGHNKAVLLYVTEKTEPQINESTKVNEVFYPAYLLIGGRLQLVNLNKTDAIDQISAETVSQDGSRFRPTIDQTTKVAINPNLLVTYTVDNNGYYTLRTSSGEVKDGTTVVEEVIKYDATQTYELKLTPNAKNGTLKLSGKDADGNNVNKTVAVDDATVIYYTYTETDTKNYEYIGFYLASEIPFDSNWTATVSGDVYLSYDEDSKLPTLDAVIIGDRVKEVKTGYEKDARLHLYAMDDTSLALNANVAYASYTFNDIYNWTEVIDDDSVKASVDASHPVVKYGVYAWDSSKGYYVDMASGTYASFKGNQTVTDVIGRLSLIFTSGNPDGIKIDEDTKIIAEVLNLSGNIASVESITFDDFASYYDSIKNFNELNDETAGEPDKTLTANIGFYENEDEELCVAYIIFEMEDLSEK